METFTRVQPSELTDKFNEIQQPHELESDRLITLKVV